MAEVLDLGAYDHPSKVDVGVLHFQHLLLARLLVLQWVELLDARKDVDLWVHEVLEVQDGEEVERLLSKHWQVGVLELNLQIAEFLGDAVALVLRNADVKRILVALADVEEVVDSDLVATQHLRKIKQHVHGVSRMVNLLNDLFEDHSKRLRVAVVDCSEYRTLEVEIQIDDGLLGIETSVD